MAEVSLPKMKQQMLSKIDQNDLVEAEKVERYISFLKRFRRLDKLIDEEGEVATTINGSQTFQKIHPALTELKNVNSQIMAIEKTIKRKSTEDVEKVELM